MEPANEETNFPSEEDVEGIGFVLVGDSQNSIVRNEEYPQEQLVEEPEPPVVELLDKVLDSILTIAERGSA